MPAGEARKDKRRAVESVLTELCRVNRSLSAQSGDRRARVTARDEGEK